MKDAHTHARADWRYWFDFALFPPLFLLAAFFYCRSMLALAGLAAGFALWTFTEYWAHRTVLHEWFWHATHQRHHQHPEEFVIFPLWRMPAFFAAVFAVASWFSLQAVFAGFLLGYIWFLALHHMLHHWPLERHPWLAAYADWHDVHHKKTHWNFGITVPVWDFVFGTHRAAAAEDDDFADYLKGEGSAIAEILLLAAAGVSAAALALYLL